MTTKPTAKKFRIRLPGEMKAAEAEPKRAAAGGTDDGFGAQPFPTATAGRPVSVSAAPLAPDRPTSRQLRTARRLASKHGVTGKTDDEIIAKLREKGVDPFERSNVLDLVPPESAEKRLDRKLPQKIRPAEPPAERSPAGAPPPKGRADEILEIQRDIARRRRRSLVMLAARLFAFVAVPTAIAAYYFFAVATPMYATHSEFVIQQADAPAAGGMGGLLAGTGLATSQDSITVQSYLQSRESMLRLEEDIGYRAHFSQDWIDPLQRLSRDASNEETYRHYARHVKIGFDPTEGIVRMEVIAADPEVSAAFSGALIAYAEEQVDTLSLRLREDQMKGSMESYREAEAKMEDAQGRVLALQERLGVLDPASETQSLMAQISNFETQLAEKRLQREQLLDNQSPNAARVAGVAGDIARLEQLVADLRSELTQGSENGGSLARISAELQMAQVDLETRTLMMQEALTQLEAARIEANRQVRYLSTGVNPIPPDEASYPRAFENTLLTFFVFAGVYLMLSLTASILREQVSG